MKVSDRPDDRPAFQFYPKDWLGETGLRICTLADRGLWLEMLCAMWRAPRRGFLEANGKQIASSELARMAGCDEAEVKQSLSRLEAAGVFSRNEDGTIYSRRMVRDEKQRLSKVEAGRAGGIVSRPKQTASRTEAKGGSPSPTPSPSPSPSTTKPVQGGSGGDSPAAPDVGVRLAQFLQAELKKHHPRATPTAGYLDADALRIIAPRIPEDQLLDLIRWAAADPHWGPVLLARGGPGVKLREHFDTLHARWESRASARPPEPSAEQRQAREATEAFKRRWRQQAASDAPATAASDLTAAGPAIDAILERLKEKSPKIGDSEKAE